MKRILVAEDETAIREFIEINLARAGYDVVGVSNGQEAIDKYEQSRGSLDLIILDIMMPLKDGVEVCKHIRKHDPIVGIIFLSAKSQEMDRVNGLMVGADDYLTKPFSPSELLARVDAIFRRMATVVNSSKQECKNQLTSEPFALDLRKKVLIKNGKEIEVSVTEYAMLELFLRDKGAAFTRAQILEKVWPNEKVDEKAVDVNIRRLRVKIEDEPSDPKYIMTVWGVGYRWIGP